MPRDVFEHALGGLGWTPGSNVVLEYRDAEKNDDALAEGAAGLIRLNVDVIVTCGGRATRVAQQSTNAIPIVMQVTMPTMYRSNLSMRREARPITHSPRSAARLHASGRARSAFVVYIWSEGASKFGLGYRELLRFDCKRSHFGNVVVI